MPVQRGERPLVVVLDFAAWEALLVRLAAQVAAAAEQAAPAPGWGKRLLGAPRWPAIAGALRRRTI